MRVACDALALLMFIMGAGAGAVLTYVPFTLQVASLRRRLAKRQGAVDWFCFWLKGEEDPDPAKAEQYKRWRELRKLQEEDEMKSVAPGN